MVNVHIHKAAKKALQKAPRRIREKVFTCISHLMRCGVRDLPFPIKPLQGHYKKYKYFEILIDKDYRIFFRQEGEDIFIRYAGTHNALGTG